MLFQKCIKCGVKFKYRDISKQLWRELSDVKCNNCGAAYKMIWMNRLFLQFLIILPMFFKNGIRSMGPNLPISVLIYLVYLAIIIALSPFILRFKLNEINNK